LRRLATASLPSRRTRLAAVASSRSSSSIDSVSRKYGSLVISPLRYLSGT
jgi:hypothetical protein